MLTGGCGLSIVGDATKLNQLNGLNGYMSYRVTSLHGYTVTRLHGYIVGGEKPLKWIFVAGAHSIGLKPAEAPC